MKIEKEEKEITLYSDSIRENMSSWIEQDIIIPDTKPDAIKIINVTVNPYVTDIDVTDGMVKVVGKLNYFIIYRTNDTNMGVRGLITSSVYSQNIPIKSLKKDMIVNVTPEVKNVIYALPNERKISVKSEVIFKVSATNKKKIPFIESFDPNQNIEVMIYEDKFSNIKETKCETISSREDIIIPKENDDFYEILKVTTDIINTEYKESYNKILVKGDIDVNVLYLVDDSAVTIKKLNLQIPFTGMIDFENIRDMSKFDIKYYIKEFNIKQNIDITTTKTFTVDYKIGVCATMYEEEDIRYVQDFYSEEKELKYDSNQARVIKSTNLVIKDLNVKENLQDVIPQNYHVIDYDVDTSYLIFRNSNSKVNVEGNIKLNLLMQNNENSDLESKAVDVLVNQEYDVPEIEERAEVSINSLVESVSLDQDGKNLEVKINLKIYIDIKNIIDIEYIDEINDYDLDPSLLDSISIYIVKPKDTLWSIAKKYKTTVDKIAKTNNIENPDKIDVGQKILIIR